MKRWILCAMGGVYGCGDEGAECSTGADCDLACLVEAIPGAVGTCAGSCSESADCGGGQVCGTNAAADGFCAPPCTTGSLVLGIDNSGAMYGCEDGRPVHTSQLSTSDCRLMGCGSSQFCCIGASSDCTVGTCVPTKAPGEICDGEVQCQSGMCVAPEAGGPLVCSVPPGQECTEANCAYCDPWMAGMRCTPTCIDPNDCPLMSSCTRFADESRGFCREICTTVGGDNCPAGAECVERSSDGLHVCRPL